MEEEGPPDDTLREMLALQLEEVEMLSSMFCNPGEFVLDDPTAQSQIKGFVDGSTSYNDIQCRIGFSISLDLQGDGQHTSELVCNLPHDYPVAIPTIFIRAPTLSRSQQKQLSEDLHKYISNLELDENELYIGHIIQWVQENGAQYVENSDHDFKNLDKTNSSFKKGEDQFSRLWIYSHHIYNKFKRKDIQEYAHQFNLTGFSMPGKPGIICVEGYLRDVEDYWGLIRKMTWKRIMVKEREDLHLGDADVDSFRRFPKFEEKVFEPRDGKGHGYHMDMGLLLQYLEEHKSSYIFSIYFGVDGKNVGDD